MGLVTHGWWSHFFHFLVHEFILRMFMLHVRLKCQWRFAQLFWDQWGSDLDSDGHSKCLYCNIGSVCVAKDVFPSTLCLVPLVHVYIDILVLFSCGFCFVLTSFWFNFVIRFWRSGLSNSIFGCERLFANFMETINSGGGDVWPPQMIFSLLHNYYLSFSITQLLSFVCYGLLYYHCIWLLGIMDCVCVLSSLYWCILTTHCTVESVPYFQSVADDSLGLLNKQILSPF